MAGTKEPSTQCYKSHVAVRMNDCIVLYEARFHPTDSIWTYNLWTEQWWEFKIPPGKMLPSTAPYQRGVAIDSDIYFFRGFNNNTFWKLIRKTDGTFDWNTINIEDKTKKPSPRIASCIWAHEKKVWIFSGCGVSIDGYLNGHGGVTGPGSKCNNQLLCYDLSMRTWKNPKCHGDIPSPRSKASAAIIKNKLWLCGGLLYQDMYELDMLSLSWTRIKTIQKPTIGCWSMLTPLTGSHLVLYGAADDLMTPWIFDVDSCTWRQLPSCLNDKHGRIGHSGITGLQGNVIIIGGRNRNIEEDDDIYTPFFCVRFEPKSLQQVAMRTIYENRTELAWKILPPKLKSKIMGPGTTML